MSPPVMPNVPPGVAPVVQVGVGDRYDAANVAAVWGGPAVATPALWSVVGDSNEWGGTEPLWHDITCEVVSIDTYAGRGGTLEPFDIGTATLTVRNLDGWAEYRPAADPAVLSMRPGRQIRVGVSIAAAAPQWLWRGTIDALEPGYVPEVGDTVTVACVDAKGDAGRAELPRTLSPVGAGETAAQRTTRILDNIGFPAWRRNIDADSCPLGATSLGARAAAELDRTAESAGGHVYGDLAGSVRQRRRDWQLWAWAAPPAATVGNIGASDICPSGWEVRFGRDDITTRAVVGRQGETPYVADNPDDAGLFGGETWTKTDLLPVDNFDLARIAFRALLDRSSQFMPRIAAVTLHAETGTGEVARLAAAASPFTPTRLRCRHRTPGGRLVFDRTMFVVSATHTLSPVDGWTIRYGLADALPYQNVETPAYWDSARWSTDDQWTLSA